MALPKPYRLRQRRDFNAVYQAGLRRSSRHLTLRGLKPQFKNVAAAVPTRIGVSISQKVSKRAVVRNRIRRQIHAALQQFLPDLVPGWRLVFVVQPSAIECDYEQFLQELKQLLVEAEVIHGYPRRNVL